MPKEDQQLVVYKSKSGQDVKLSLEMIKNFLVVGNKDLVTVQEFFFFMGICRARGLDPTAKDVYLIKYGSEPAAIVTAIDFYRSRSRAQKDCKGWQKGVICLNEKTGELRNSKGIVLPGEKLLGGWFKARPEGWDVDFELEVNLAGYIKTTKENKITRFWQPENQPTMIMKVAESQGLRTLWPDEFGGTISAEEAGLVIPEGTAGLQPEDDKDKGGGEKPEVLDTSAFDDMIVEKQLSVERKARVDARLKEIAIARTRTTGKKFTVADVKVDAGSSPSRFEQFWASYEKWEEIKHPSSAPSNEVSGTTGPEVAEKEPGAAGAAETQQSGTGPEQQSFAGEEGDGTGPALEPQVETMDQRINRVRKTAVLKLFPIMELQKATGKPLTQISQIDETNIDLIEPAVQAFVPVGRGKGK